MLWTQWVCIIPGLGMKKSYPGDPYFVKKYPMHNFYLVGCSFRNIIKSIDNQKESEENNSLVDLKGGVILPFLKQGKTDICFWADKWKSLIVGQKRYYPELKYSHSTSQTISWMFMLTICLEISDLNLSADDSV